MDPIIDVTIGPDGTVRIETSGFEGGACEQATRALEDALGTTTSYEHTSEFYADEKLKVTR